MKLTNVLFFLALARASSHAVTSDPYDPTGGQKYVSTHSSRSEILLEQHQYEGFPDEDIKEWHFHVYFFQNNEESTADAMRLKDEIVEQVRKGSFIAVCDGVDETVIPGFNRTDVPGVNMGPRGPHPAGSYEVWVPVEVSKRNLRTSHARNDRQRPLLLSFGKARRAQHTNVRTTVYPLQGRFAPFYHTTQQQPCSFVP